MTATNITLQGLGPVRWRRAARLLLWVSLLTPFAAQAENVLQNISFAPGDAGRVDITLQLTEGAPDAQVFTTDEPPRIAIDLPGTRSEAPRRVAVGAGATSAVSAVEAAGRTRVVVDLFRPAPYETRMEGNNFIISVAGGAGATIAANAALISSDPVKQYVGAMEVSSVDFRRTPEGGGRVVVTFTGEGAPVDMRAEQKRIVVEMPGVRVPAEQVQQLDVVDFATPVNTITTSSTAGGGRIIVAGEGPFESMAYQSGNEYVIEVSPPAVAGGAVAGGSLIEGEAAEGAYAGKPVTFNFQDIPVRTVLQLIAEESGLNIVAADTVAGNVTLRLINVPWDQALEIVLRAKGLEQRRDGNVVWVAPQAEIATYERAQAEARAANEALAPLLTEYIQINYANAEDIAGLLTEGAKVNQQAQSSGGAANVPGAQERGFLSRRGSVTFDSRTNTVLINDTAEKITEVRRLIALLDRPVDQVLIEAKIVIASEDFARELGARFGVSGGYETGNGNLITTTGSLGGADRMANLGLLNNARTNGATGLPVAQPGSSGGGIQVPAIGDRLNVNLPVAGSAGSIGFAILGADYLLDLELSALETEGRGEVVSNPRVITANQREATIRQGDEVGYVTIAPTAGTVPIPNVQFKEVLLELVVTPTITKDGRVFLVLAVKKDDIEGMVETSIGDVPQIATREISTAVLVDNGQTVVVGGVYEFSNREDLAKVPFLGDIPVLGNLFKRKGREVSKAELLIFVTPKILNVPGRSE
jgi:type IV pilus assembly protein PilQ